MKNSVRKQAMCLLVGILWIFALYGCGENQGEDATKEANRQQSEETASPATEQDTEVQDAAPDADDDLIYYTYQSHPVALYDGDQLLSEGNYYTITLDQNSEKRYPKLAERLEAYNGEQESQMIDYIKSTEAEVVELFSTGWGLGYEEYYGFIPVRADGNVFSFVNLESTYLGGAHGFVSYAAYNIDPVTGEDISFLDVVKDQEKLPDIIVDELKNQNEDLADYFEDIPSDMENLRAGIPDRYEDNARNLSWAIDYDGGIWIYFEDYAMGSYAAGSQSVKIMSGAYPEILSDKYLYSEDVTELPAIDNQAKELKDAELSRIESTSHVEYSEEGEETWDDGVDGEDWWYDIRISNPGWSAYVKDGIDAEAGMASVTLKEISHDSSDWLDEESWAADTGFALPQMPYDDGTYYYSAENDGDNGRLFLNVSYSGGGVYGGYNFEEFIDPPDRGESLFADMAEQEIKYARFVDDILYVSMGHRTYASASPHTSYMMAISESGEVLWKSEDQVCGSNNFVIAGDSIICGYGFTDEPDYIYVLNRENGKVQDRIKVKTSPYYFIPVGEGELYVLTYDTVYLYQMDE